LKKNQAETRAKDKEFSFLRKFIGRNNMLITPDGDHRAISKTLYLPQVSVVRAKNTAAISRGCANP